jgi:hypothetical protein
MKSLLVAASIVALAACGGGKAATSSSTPASAPAAASTTATPAATTTPVTTETPTTTTTPARGDYASAEEVAAGIDCTSYTPKHEEPTRGIDAGPPPTSEGNCQRDGVTLSISTWANANDRGKAEAAAKVLFQMFAPHDAAVTGASGHNVMLGDEADNMVSTAEAIKVIKRAADQLDLDVIVIKGAGS